MRSPTSTIAAVLVPASLLWAPPAPSSAGGVSLAGASMPVASIVVGGTMLWPLERRVPPAPWQAADPADSLYRSARSALNDGEFARAAELFRQIVQRYPRSEYAPDAPYWEAFARYRLGGERNYRAALAALDAQRTRFPRASTRGDAQTLATRIQGELARQGDSEGAARVLEAAAGDKADKADRRDKPDRSTKADRASKAGRGGASGSCAAGGDDDDGDDESDTRIAALNALMQMDSERALPILREVLARRDACSEGLRRKALFLVAQKHTPDATDILLDAARSDPDADVRRQAVFWMSQVGGERAVVALDSILRNSTDSELREKAIFALSQQNDERGRRLLREFAQSSAPADLRSKAVFWLGQNDHSSQNAAFLRALYAREQSEGLRDQIIQAAANTGDLQPWLFTIAQDPKEPVESRKKALFWLGQSRRTPVGEFVSLYERLKEPEIREQLIFVLSQRREEAATVKLMDIARNETDRRLRGKALFWLGQKNDPRVKQLLMEIINQ